MGTKGTLSIGHIDVFGTSKLSTRRSSPAKRVLTPPVYLKSTPPSLGSMPTPTAISILHLALARAPTPFSAHLPQPRNPSHAGRGRVRFRTTTRAATTVNTTTTDAAIEDATLQCGLRGFALASPTSYGFGQVGRRRLRGAVGMRMGEVPAAAVYTTATTGVNANTSNTITITITTSAIADPGYGRGVPFWAFYFSGQGSLARVTPLFLCDFTYSSCFTLAKLFRNAKVI